MTPSRKPRIVRLWWRCGLCRWKFDTFGTSHAEDREAMTRDSRPLNHLESEHGITVRLYSQVNDHIFDAGKTSRVVRKTVMVDG